MVKYDATVRNSINQVVQLRYGEDGLAGQAGFRKRRTRDQIANVRWIIEKTMEFQKNIYFCFTLNI